MAKRVRSARRTELRKQLRQLYLDQSAYLLIHSKQSIVINQKIAKAKSALGSVDRSSIHVDMPTKRKVKL